MYGVTSMTLSDESEFVSFASERERGSYEKRDEKTGEKVLPLL